MYIYEMELLEGGNLTCIFILVDKLKSPFHTVTIVTEDEHFEMLYDFRQAFSFIVCMATPNPHHHPTTHNTHKKTRFQILYVHVYR